MNAKHQSLDAARRDQPADVGRGFGSYTSPWLDVNCTHSASMASIDFEKIRQKSYPLIPQRLKVSSLFTGADSVCGIEEPSLSRRVPLVACPPVLELWGHRFAIHTGGQAGQAASGPDRRSLQLPVSDPRLPLALLSSPQ